MRLGSRGTGRGRRAVGILAALALAGLCLVCVAPSLLTPGSGRAEIPPYGGAAWDDGGTTYHTTASQKDVLNYYKVQFGERGFYSVSLCPGAGERAEDYLAPHPRIQYGDPGSAGPESGPAGGVRRTFVSFVSQSGYHDPCGNGTEAVGSISGALDCVHVHQARVQQPA